ncbi:Sialidase [Sordaria brevicollis]|uniref:Sialidase n=1 Tax=Sordaria brevicollis TaxID=83679 RepID=A0AAE0NVI6_SORBR|nr:Sialidase [Sordaria brevicollis]
MFSLLHNPRTFLRVIVGLAFLMCFLTNMVSGGPLAERVRDAFHGHRPWTAHQDLRRHDTQGESAGAGAGGVIRIAASPALIDPQGVYIRASPLFSSDGAPDTSRIIAGYAATSGPDRVLRVSLSTNSGTSWSALGEVTRRPADGTSDLDNAMPLALPSGRIIMAFRHHSLYPFPSSPATNFVYTHYRLDVCFSDDGGRTWSFLSHIDERPASPQLNGLWEPFLRLASDGRTIQAYYSSENSASDQDNLMRFSTDEGLTWSDPPILVSSSPHANSRDGMTGVSLVSSDPCRKKELICVFETTLPDGTFTISSVFSSDDGLTWGHRKTVYTAAGKKWAGAPQVYLVGETLVVSFLTNEGTDLPKIDGAYTKLVTSQDGGRSWRQRSGEAVTVAGTRSHWPGLFGLDGTRFLALYSVDGRGAVGHFMGVGGE